MQTPLLGSHPERCLPSPHPLHSGTLSIPRHQHGCRGSKGCRLHFLTPLPSISQIIPLLALSLLCPHSYTTSTSPVHWTLSTGLWNAAHPMRNREQCLGKQNCQGLRLFQFQSSVRNRLWKQDHVIAQTNRYII